MGKRAVLRLTNNDTVDAPYMLTAAFALANASSTTAQANCNLKDGSFRTFAPTSLTVPVEANGTAGIAHGMLLGWVQLVPGESKTIRVECFGPRDTQLFDATLTAVKVGVLTIQ